MSRLKNTSNIYWFYAVCFIGLLIEWLLFTFSVAWTGGNNLVTIAKGIGDCAMLLIPFWLLPNKSKGWTLLILWLISAFFLCNLWYCRFWDNLIPINFYRLSSNVNGDLVNSVKALIKASDCIIVIVPSLATLYYFLYARPTIPVAEVSNLRNTPDTGRKLETSATSNRLIGIGVTLAAFLLSQAAYSVTTLKWNRGSGLGAQTFTAATLERLSVENPASLHDFSYNGLSVYGIQAAIGIAKDLTTKKGIELTPQDIKRITEYLGNVPELKAIPGFSDNRDKNLIIILVESLNAEVINKEFNGHPITPFMNSILDSMGTVTALNIIPQVKQGCSNDGQLLTNTGLLPLNYGVSSMEFGEKNIYPNLVDILNRPEAVAVFGDTGYTWNQTEAYRSYGFKTIHPSSDYDAESEKLGKDRGMFRFGEKIIANLRQPFFAEFVTFSMHVPFTDKAVPIKEWLKDSDLAVNEINYLNMTRYFDESLKGFVDFLKDRHLYDNTVIVIVSDHSQGLAVEKSEFASDNNDRQDALPMMFMALNTGFTFKKTDVAGQVNVFPTILQIMDRTDSQYHGMDRSLIDPELRSAITTKGNILGTPSNRDAARQQRSFNVADSLQRGDYFRRL